MSSVFVISINSMRCDYFLHVSRNYPYFDVFQNYVARSQERDELVTHLREFGIEILISWPKPMHHQKALGLGHFHLPKTERISKEVLSLPLNTEISNEQVGFVIDSIRNFYKG